ncbi:unnamed protein product, partial [Didymodactylos carnosus]
AGCNQVEQELIFIKPKIMYKTCGKFLFVYEKYGQILATSFNMFQFLYVRGKNILGRSLSFKLELQNSWVSGALDNVPLRAEVLMLLPPTTLSPITPQLPPSFSPKAPTRLTITLETHTPSRLPTSAF